MFKPSLNIVEISHRFDNNNNNNTKALYASAEYRKLELLGCLQVQNEVALHQFTFAYRRVNYQ